MALELAPCNLAFKLLLLPTTFMEVRHRRQFEEAPNGRVRNNCKVLPSQGQAKITTQEIELRCLIPHKLVRIRNSETERGGWNSQLHQKANERRRYQETRYLTTTIMMLFQVKIIKPGSQSVSNSRVLRDSNHPTTLIVKGEKNAFTIEKPGSQYLI